MRNKKCLQFISLQTANVTCTKQSHFKKTINAQKTDFYHSHLKTSLSRERKLEASTSDKQRPLHPNGYASANGYANANGCASVNGYTIANGYAYANGTPSTVFVS